MPGAFALLNIMRGLLRYLMIFILLCIGLFSGLPQAPAYAADPSSDDPALVREALERAASDRRFSYPEGYLPASPLDISNRMNKVPGEPAPGAGRTHRGIGKINAVLFNYIFISIAVIAVAFIIYGVLMNMRTRRLAKGAESKTPSVQGLEDLNQSWHLAHAEKLIREGKYFEALSSLMLAMLLALESRKMVRYHRSRTNREYLANLRPHPLLFSVAGEFMHHFELFKYGGRTPDSDSMSYLLDLYNQLVKALPAPSDEPIMI